MPKLGLGAGSKQVDRQIFISRLRTEASRVSSDKIISEKAVDRLVLFNVCSPINEMEVASRLAFRLGGDVIGREMIRDIAKDDKARTDIWNSFSTKVQKALSVPAKTQNDLLADGGDVMKHLVKTHGLSAEVLMHDTEKRRQIRMALLAFELGLSQDKFTVSWGAGTNILFPESLRFYIDLDLPRLAKMYAVSLKEIEKQNKEKGDWYRKVFRKDRSDPRYYTAALYDVPDWIDSPEELHQYLAEFMFSVIQSYERTK